MSRDIKKAFENYWNINEKPRYQGAHLIVSYKTCYFISLYNLSLFHLYMHFSEQVGDSLGTVLLRPFTPKPALFDASLIEKEQKKLLSSILGLKSFSFIIMLFEWSTFVKDVKRWGDGGVFPHFLLSLSYEFSKRSTWKKSQISSSIRTFSSEFFWKKKTLISFTKYSAWSGIASSRLFHLSRESAYRYTNEKTLLAHKIRLCDSPPN